MNRQPNGKYPRFRCPTRMNAPETCQCISITEKKLYAVILETLQQQICELVDAKAVIDSVRKQRPGIKTNEYALAIQKAEREKKRLMDAKFKVYDDYANGLITQDDYKFFSQRYDAELAIQESSIEKNRQSMSALAESRKQDDEFVNFFETYGNIQSLDREIVTQLVDRVVYYTPDHMEIYFRFSDIQQKIVDLAFAIAEQDQVKQGSI